MASHSYSKSGTRSRILSHESSSSDLFDEMLEEAVNSDLKPPPPKTQSRSNSHVPISKLKQTHPNTTDRYSYHNRFEDMPTPPVPVHDILSHAGTGDGAPMEWKQPEPPTHATAVMPTQQISKTEKMKVFDFDDDEDLAPVGIKTMPTGTGAARGATPPSGPGGQKLVRRVRVDHAGWRAGVSAKRSKVAGEAYVGNNKRFSLSKTTRQSDKLDDCDATSGSVTNSAMTSVKRSPISSSGTKGSRSGVSSRSYNMGAKSLSDPGTKGLLDTRSKPESRSVFGSRNNSVGSRTESKKTSGLRTESKGIGSTEPRNTLESSAVNTFGSGTESKSTSRVGESRSWARPLLNSGVNEAAPPTEPPTTPPNLPGALNKKGKFSKSELEPSLPLSRHKRSPKPAKPDSSDDPYAFSLDDMDTTSSDSRPLKRPRPHTKVDSSSKPKSNSKAKGDPVVQVKADYSNLKRKKADSAVLLPSKTSQMTPQALFQNAESASSGETDMLQEIDSLLEGGSEERGRGLELCEGGASNSIHKSFTTTSVPDHTYVQRTLNFPAEPHTSGGVPSLSKSSSWPRRGGASLVPKKGGTTLLKKDKLLIQNVRQAHQCMELGENWQFFEEAHYMLDNLKPSQPVHVRCLGACNLATHYLDPEFSRQLRAHSYTSRITALLKDSLQQPALCLSAAVLFYVITRDKLNNEWDVTGTQLLVGMLGSPDATGRELTGKAAREMARIKTKARSILEKVADQTSQGIDTPPPEDEDDDSELPLSQPVPKKEEEEEEGGGGGKERGFRVRTDEISVEELSRECIISLTSPQNNPQWLRDELRLQGALDRLANMVIASCEELANVDCSGLGSESCDYSASITHRTLVLQRQLKSIENLTLLNKNNQSYLIIFDGSVLLTKLTQFLKTGHRLLSFQVLRLSTQHSLLAVFKVLLNLTHESELGAHRVGEQRDVMVNTFRVLMELPEIVPPGDRFDISILALGLLINLTEHSPTNCKLLETLHVLPRPQFSSSSQGSCDLSGHTSSQGSCDQHDSNSPGVVNQRTHKASIRALTNLFLHHHQKADSANIEVPTPQRLSQINGPSSSSAAERRGEGPSSSKSARLSDKTQTFSSPGKSQTSTKGSSSASLLEGVAPPEEGDGEYEKVDLDPLVFDREEFNSALDQAGRHMEDSILSSYVALLLGMLAEHNHDTVDFVRNLMPSNSFSEMVGVLKKFVSFMNITGSVTGLDSLRHTIKFLEAV